MNDLVSRAPDFSKLLLERTKGGHIVTPWFTMDLPGEFYCGPYTTQVPNLLREMFAKHLNEFGTASDVMVFSRFNKDLRMLEFRLQTRSPQPEPYVPQTPERIHDPTAIDV